MRIVKWAAAAAIMVSLGACMQTPTERAVAGGLAGALIADGTGGNVLTGAAIGAAAGAVSCGLPGLPPCRTN